MRFAAAHKTATYLAVGCAFLALVLSGELGIAVVSLAAIGLIGSWWWEPPRVRIERWQTALTVASALVFAWSVTQLLLGADVLLLGAEFLLYLQIAKLFSRQGLRDYLQIYVLSFLMLTAGTVLNSELTYGLFFLGYVVTASWALMLFHLRREIEEHYVVPARAGAALPSALARVLGSRRIVDRRFFVGSTLVSLGVFLSAAALFLFIPRIGFGLFVSKSRGGVTMAGFSDGVRLGGHGLIRDDDTVVMRVVLAHAPTGRTAPALHWRGVAFDQYLNGEWRRSHAAPETRQQVTLDGRNPTYHLLYDGPPLDDAALADRAGRAVRQDVYLEPLGSSVLFGASMPLAFSFEAKPVEKQSEKPKRGSNDEVRRYHGSGIKYTVLSEPAPPPAQALRGAADTLPQGFEVYTQVPPQITERVRQKALELTAGATNDYDRMVALERWLKANLGYTLEQRSPGRDEPIDFFVFERRLGHCEYFASALAIMGRVAGVPTRNVNGFLGGEWNEYDDYMAVRAGDAHSWVEAYFPGHGWVTFDPTPAVETTGLGRGGDGVLDRLRRLADTMRFKWFKWIIEYDLSRQLDLLKQLGGFLRGGASKLFKEKSASAKAWAAEHKVPAAIAAALLGLVVAAITVWRRRKQETQAVLGGAMPRGPRHAATQTYVRVLRQLARHGHRKSVASTPREHALKLAVDGIAGAAELAELCELHYAAEYGGGAAGLGTRARVLEVVIAGAQADARRRRRRAGWRARLRWLTGAGPDQGAGPGRGAGSGAAPGAGAGAGPA